MGNAEYMGTVHRNISSDILVISSSAAH